MPLAVNLNHWLKINQTAIDSMQSNELVSQLSSNVESVSVTEVDYGVDLEINGVVAVTEVW
ncbi:MAG: hypothetical protein LVT47_12665 [Cyanobacteria bacterium LVE1205-1]